MAEARCRQHRCKNSSSVDDSPQTPQDRRLSVLERSGQLLSRASSSQTTAASSKSPGSSISNSTSREWNSLDDLLEDDCSRDAGHALPRTPELPAVSKSPPQLKRQHCRRQAWQQEPARGGPESADALRSAAVAAPSQADRDGVTHTLATWAIQEMARPTSGNLEQMQHQESKLAELEGQRDQLREELFFRTQELQSMQQQFAWWQNELSAFEKGQQCLEEENRVLREELVAERKIAAERQHDDANCVVCLDSSATYVVVPCGHLALCENCRSRRMQSCPVCRQPSSMVIKLFKL